MLFTRQLCHFENSQFSKHAQIAVDGIEAQAWVIPLHLFKYLAGSQIFVIIGEELEHILTFTGMFVTLFLQQVHCFIHIHEITPLDGSCCCTLF